MADQTGSIYQLAPTNGLSRRPPLELVEDELLLEELELDELELLELDELLLEELLEELELDELELLLELDDVVPLPTQTGAT